MPSFCIRATVSAKPIASHVSKGPSSQLYPHFIASSIATTLSVGNGGHINVGGSAHDSAKLTGATTNAGGTVTYSVYSDSDCSEDKRAAGTVTVTNGQVPDSDTLQFNTAGTFFWQAVYSGDTNNKTATSPDRKSVV